MMYDESPDAIAAEYVLGTLSADERDHAEAMLAIDPAFAEAVRVWERRLGELNVMVEAVEPPPELWDKIRGEIKDAVPSPEPSPAERPGSVPKPAADFVDRDEFAAHLADSTPSLSPAETSADAERASDLHATSLAPALGEPGASTPFAPASSYVSAASQTRGADVVLLSRQARRWRRVSAAFATLAAVLAIIAAVAIAKPDLIERAGIHPSTRVALAPSSAAEQWVAALQQDPVSPAFVLSLDPQTGLLTVRRVSAAAEPGRSYELWVTANQNAKPRSLGLIGGNDYTQRPLPTGISPASLSNAIFAVSLEPTGGSKTGAPSGPVLFTGKLVQALPPVGPAASPHT